MKKHFNLIIVLLLIAGSVYYLESGKTNISGEVKDADIAINSTDSEVGAMTLEKKAKKYERAKEIVQPGQFFNTANNEPITIEELIGKKIIMVDFWTYSCINCQRTTPYLNAWHDKYADDGLVILGLHSPEFDFEKDPANVQDAIDRFGIEYPVIQDNDFGTWRAYKNRYWPRKYLIDIDGFIVYDHIGEGAYQKTEKKIQELLSERAQRLNENVNFINGEYIDPDNPKKPSSRSISPEIYFGAWRNDRLANGEPRKEGVQSLVVKDDRSLKTSELYLDGKWNILKEYAQNESIDAKIIFPFQASDVFMVLSADSPVSVVVKVNGKVISQQIAGQDVDRQGVVAVQKERLYKLVEGADVDQIHSLELVIKQPGLKAFTFTFG